MKLLTMLSLFAFSTLILGAEDPMTFNVTDGNLRRNGDLYVVEDSEMRAVLPSSGNPNDAVLKFTYHGASLKTSRLGNGEVRQQFGIKLRAQDICNLVYVMWRFEPKGEIVVSVKRNLGKSTSRQCADNGYVNVKPKQSVTPPPVSVGDRHVLEAHVVDQEMIVLVDRRVVWSGTLPSSANLTGPIGVRSDNVRASFSLGIE